MGEGGIELLQCTNGFSHQQFLLPILVFFMFKGLQAIQILLLASYQDSLSSGLYYVLIYIFNKNDRQLLFH
jgi:hypothetical protein